LNQRELTRIGKRFILVTPYTSLLVLETAAQYERYRVVPPKSRPQIYQEFVDRMGPVNALSTTPSSDESDVVSEDATGLRRVSTSGADRVVIMGQDPSREALRQALLGTVMVWDQLARWWRDPKEFMAPPPEPPKDDTLWDWSDPRTLLNAEALANIEYAAKLRRSRELARDALRARQSGDLPDALHFYSQAVALNPGNTAAALGRSELIEASAGQDRNSAARARLAGQARRLTAASASAFRAALGRSGQDLAQNDLAGADFEIDQARAALGDLGAWGEEDRKQFNAELADARHRVDAARLTTARNAREKREKLIFDAHFQGDANQMRVGVNRGGGYHRSDYGGGWAAGGNSGLFGGGGGGNSSLNPPAAPSTPPATPLASIGAITPLASNIILPWDPEMPYLTALQRVPPDKAYDAYLEQRATFGRCPEFYLDCADYLQRAGQHAMAARVVSDVAAFHLADPELLTRAAYRYQELGEWDRAIELFERVVKMRPDDRQGVVNLALALSDRADSTRSPRADARAALRRTDSRHDGERISADYRRCLGLLNAVIVREARLSEVDMSCLMDANRVIARVERLESAGAIPPVPVPLDPRLIRDLDCDLRVVVTSDTAGYTPDWTVTEPDGSVAQSGFYVTPIGGRIDGSDYCLRTLVPGLYRLKTIGFVGSSPERLTGVCTVRVTVFTDFGRPGEKCKSMSLRMTSLDQKIDLGIVTRHGMALVFQKLDNLLSVETSP
jgi:tetratricopeptide (TPR) repeat protein